MDTTKITFSTDAPKLPDRIVLYAQEGLGKTTFGASFETPVFVQAPGETGLQTLASNGLLPTTPYREVSKAGGWGEYMETLTFLAKEGHDFKTVVVDCIDGIESIWCQHECETYEGGEEKFFAWAGQGIVQRIAQWERQYAAFDYMRKRGIQPVILAHATTGKIKNPDGLDYDRRVPSLHREVWSGLKAWADMVLYMGYKTIVSGDPEQGKGKAKGGTKRVMYCAHTATIDAKNRHGLPPTLDLPDTPEGTYQAFQDALTK